MDIKPLLKKLTLVSEGEAVWTREDNEMLLEYIYILDDIKCCSASLLEVTNNLMNPSASLEDAMDSFDEYINEGNL
jgi:hypothetical protein